MVSEIQPKISLENSNQNSLTLVSLNSNYSRISKF